MPPPSPTLNQIKAQVSAIQKKVDGARVIGIRAAGHWSGPSTARIGDQEFQIAACASPLAMRLALRETPGPNCTQVLITNLAENELGEDILLRLAKRRLFPLDAWQIVKGLFQATTIDPRLSRHHWIAELLVDGIPTNGYPPVPGAFLAAETVWPILLNQVLGLPGDRPDLTAILKWSTTRDALQRYRSASPQFREAASDWLSEIAGPAVVPVLLSVETLPNPDAVPVGLALGVVSHPAARARLERSAVRMEERFLGGSVPEEQVVARWSAAASDLIRIQQIDMRTRQQLLDRTDEILKDVDALEFAHVSSTSPRGYHQRLEAFGKRLIATLALSDISVGLEPLQEARDQIANHEAARDRKRLEAIDMAMRLVRWLATEPGQSGAADQSLVTAAQYQVLEAGYVDWARWIVGQGDPVAGLSEAFAKLFDRVTAVREKQAHAFADLLRVWTETDQQATGVTPVERVISDVVAPLAQDKPVLFVVVDGMSAAVCRELLTSHQGHEWIALCRDGAGGQVAAGLAALPSVTEISRTSLLCGMLKAGAANDEQAGFTAHPALQGLGRGKDAAPVLFHKPELRNDEDATLAPEVRARIGSSCRVVAVVLNAVDDTLSGGQQVGHRWNRGSIPVLAALLHEARQTRRWVVLTSDHGHVLERNTKFYAHEGGERWRTADGPVQDSEVKIKGRRVVLPENKTVIVPWSESVRYGIKKNGYHGGVNPQEMVTPIVVLSPGEEPPAGWMEAPVDEPTWWGTPLIARSDLEQAGPVAPTVRVRSSKPVQPTLFDRDEPPVPQQPAASAVTTQEPAWLVALFASEIFGQQKKLVGRQLRDDQIVRTVLRALDQHGGRMTAVALARAVNYPAHRLPGLLATLQRLLNLDGFGVLARDENSDTVELNRDLLRRQFGV